MLSEQQKQGVLISQSFFECLDPAKMHMEDTLKYMGEDTF